MESGEGRALAAPKRLPPRRRGEGGRFGAPYFHVPRPIKGAESGVLGLLTQPRDPMVELFAVNPADGQPRAIAQNHDRVAVEKGLPLLDPFEVHQSRAIETKKFFGHKARFCRLHRFATKVRRLADME